MADKNVQVKLSAQDVTPGAVTRWGQSMQQAMQKAESGAERAVRKTGLLDRALDKLPGSARRAGQSLGSALESAGRKMDRLKQKTGLLKQAMDKVGMGGLGGLGKAGVLALGLTLLTGGVVKATNAYASFERQMGMVSTMLDETSMGHEEYTRSLARYESGLKDLSVEMGESTETLSKGLYDILSASIAPAQALDVLEVSAKAAKAGFTDTATAVDLITSVLNAYGMEAERAGDVSDIAFAVVASGKTTFAELAQSIGRVAPTAAAMDVSLEQTGAMLATITRQGVKTEEAVTSLNAMLSSFMKAQPAAVKAWKELSEGTELQGVAFGRSLVQGENFLKFLNIMRGASDKQKTAVFGNIRAFKGLAAILQDTAGYQRDLARTMDAAGETQRAYEKAWSGVDKAMGAASQAGIRFWTSVGKLISPVTISALEKFTKLMVTAADAVDVVAEWNNKRGKGSDGLTIEERADKLAKSGTQPNQLPAVDTSKFSSKVRQEIEEFKRFWGNIEATPSDNTLFYLKQKERGHLSALETFARVEKRLGKLAQSSIERIQQVQAELAKIQYLIKRQEAALAKLPPLPDPDAETVEKGLSTPSVADNMRKWRELEMAQMSDIKVLAAIKDARDKATKDEVQAAKKAAADKLRANQSLSDSLARLTSSNTDYQLRQLDAQVTAWRKAGADETKLAAYEAAQRKKILGAAEADKLKATKSAKDEIRKLTETETERLAREYRERLDKYKGWLDEGKISHEEFNRAVQALDKKYRTQHLTGWRKTLAEWANAYQNTTALMEEGAKRTFNMIASSFKSLVSDALQGEFDSIADFFDELGRKILEIWADVLIQMAARWAMSGIGQLIGGLLDINTGSSGSSLGSSLGTSFIGKLLGLGAEKGLGYLLGAGASTNVADVLAAAGLAPEALGPAVAGGGGAGAGAAGTAGVGAAGAAAGLGTLAAGAGIGAAAIGIMYGVTSLLGSLTADPWDKESATEMINAQADYLRRIQELQSSGGGPNLFSQDSIDAVLWGDKLAGIAEMSPAQLQELYYSTGSAGARIYSGAHTSKSLEDHLGGILSNWQRTFIPGAEYANTGETDTLYYTLASLTSEMGLSGTRQTQLLTGVEDLINQYNTGKLDLDEGNLSQNEALAGAVQGFYLDTLNEMMESGEITMEHMRAIQRMLADADTSLIPFFDTSGMGEWESPFTLNNLTDDQFMEMLELEGAVEDARVEVLGQLKTVMDGLKQSEYDWAASMYESLAAIDTQNMSSEELAETINNELNPALHIQRNLERDLADGMSMLDAHTKARNETINALLSSTGLSADRERELIDILIRESGTVQDLTGKWDRYNEIQELLSSAHNLTQEQIQDLVNEGRDLHEQLGLNQTDFSNLTDSVEDLVDEIGRLIDYLDSIPSSVNTSVNTHYNNYHHDYYNDNGGQYHDGGWAGGIRPLVAHAGAWARGRREIPAVLLAGERVLSLGEIASMGGAAQVDYFASHGLPEYPQPVDLTQLFDLLMQPQAPAQQSPQVVVQPTPASISITVVTPDGEVIKQEVRQELLDASENHEVVIYAGGVGSEDGHYA